MIPQLRERVYKSYDGIINDEIPLSILFPRFDVNSKRVWWKGDVAVPFTDDSNYLVGDIVGTELLNCHGSDYTGFVVDTSDGIKLFENYHGTFSRPAVVSEDRVNLIIDVAELKKAINNSSDVNSRLNGRSVEEIIDINFNAFPKLMHYFNSMSVDMAIPRKSFKEFFGEELKNKLILF